MKKYLAISMAVAMMLSLAACGGSEPAPAPASEAPAASGAPAPEAPAPAGNTVEGDFIMATGGTSGTYYGFGGVICSQLNKTTGSNITANSTGASVENVRLLASGDADFATVQTDVLAYAVKGDTFQTFKESGPIENVKAIACLYPEVVQCFTTNPDIKTVGDLRGKRVSMGAPGSGVRVNAEQFLEAYGMTAADVEVRDLSFAETATAMQDGSIDAGFVVAGVPNPAIVELSVSKPVQIISLGEAEMDKLIAKYPFYGKHTITKDVYGSNEDGNTLAIKCVLIARSELEEDDVYNLTKALFETQPELATAHAKGKELNKEDALVGVLPGNVHPGAARYYEEIGVKVP